MNPYTFLRSALRRAWIRWPSRGEAMLRDRKEYHGVNKRQKWTYQCNICKEWFAQKEIVIDHIKPCGSLLNQADIGGFVERLFCIADQLQVLCPSCHKIKTKEERRKK